MHLEPLIKQEESWSQIKSDTVLLLFGILLEHDLDLETIEVNGNLSSAYFYKKYRLIKAVVY